MVCGSSRSNRRNLAARSVVRSLGYREDEDLGRSQETITENPRNNSISRKSKFFIFTILEILAFNGLLFYLRLHFIFILYAAENRSFVL